MAIREIVTRGYGFANGTIFLPTRGYGSYSSVPPVPYPLTLRPRRTALTLEDRSAALTLCARGMTLTLKDRSTILTLRTRSTSLTLRDSPER